MEEELRNVIETNNWQFCSRWSYMIPERFNSVITQYQWVENLYTTINHLAHTTMMSQPCQRNTVIDIIGNTYILEYLFSMIPAFSYARHEIWYYGTYVELMGVLGDRYKVLSVDRPELGPKIILHYRDNIESYFSCLYIDNLDFFNYIIPDERIGIFKKPKKFKINDNKRIIS